MNPVKRKIFALCHLSPPVHGASLVGDKVCEFLMASENVSVKTRNLSSSKSVSNFNSSFVLKMFRGLFKAVTLPFEILWFNPDVVYFTPAIAGRALVRDWLILKTVSCVCSLGVRFRWVIHLHMRPTKGGAFAKKMINDIFRGNDIILLSDLLIEDFDNQAIKSSSNIHFVENYVDPLSVASSLATDGSHYVSTDSRLKILYFGHMIESKGCFRVLNIASSLKKDFHINEFSVTFVGEFQGKRGRADFEDAVFRFGLQDEVTIKAPVFDSVAKARLFDGHSVLLAPSYSEAFPLTYMEAQSVGLPVFATDVGAVAAVVCHECGVTVPFQGCEKTFLLEFTKQLASLHQGGIKFSRQKIIENFEKSGRKHAFFRSLSAVFELNKEVRLEAPR